jgi:hypothetical protein
MLSETARRRLNYVQASSADADLHLFPDFLIIGPQRTGSTWLHANLREHPQVMLAEPKELFFFSRLATPDHPGFRSADLNHYLSFFRETRGRIVLKHLHCLWRYGEGYRPLVRGEATASYAALEPAVIADVATLNPEIKAIMLLRDPIDRAWSHAKKDLARKKRRGIDQVPATELERFFRDPYQLRCASYVDNYDHWAAALKPGNLFVGLFEAIRLQPENLLLDVMSFLGVKRDSRYVGSSARTTVNPTSGEQIPERYRRFLEDLLGAERERLRQRFGSLLSAAASKARVNP